MRRILAVVIGLFWASQLNASTVILKGSVSNISSQSGVNAAYLINSVGSLPVSFSMELNFSSDPVKSGNPSYGLFGTAVSSNFGNLSLPSDQGSLSVEYVGRPLAREYVFDLSAGSGDFHYLIGLVFDADTGALKQNKSYITASYRGNQPDYGSVFWNNITLETKEIPEVFTSVPQYKPLPEPATWIMMTAAFGLVGGCLRRPTQQRAAFTSRARD